MTPILVLVGPPGAGKTSVGRRAAHELGVTFRDTDADIVDAAGKSVADIFVDDGEPAFRAAEREAVARALAEADGVLSLGGGAVLDEGTRGLLAGHRVVYLSVGLSDAVHRVGLARDRPVLAMNPRATLRALLDERRPLYEQVATVTVDTAGRSPAAIVADVVAYARRSEEPHP